MIGRILRVRYELTQSLGEGPIFHTFVARDRVVGKDVSVRVLKDPFAGEAAFVQALKDAVAKFEPIRHDNLERLFEVDSDEGSVFVVGEVSRGTQLNVRIRKLAPFSGPVALTTAISVCEGLSALHDQGRVHGDVGSHNIVVANDGAARLQLAGIWEAYSSSPSSGPAVLPSISPYLAPEVSHGSMPSYASDVYGVGVVLFELLTGRWPFWAENVADFAVKHARETPPDPKSLNPATPAVLSQIVAKALAKRPEDRYRHAAEMLGDLRMAHDALRFGRSVHVQLRANERGPSPASATRVDLGVGSAAAGGAPVGAAGASASPTKWTSPASDPYRVSPLSPKVAESGNRRGRGERPEDYEPDDVPAWLKMVMIFLGSLVVFVVGAFVLFNLNRPKEMVVPDVRRLTIGEAESRLDSLGLSLRVVRREVNESYAFDTILSTDPPPGAKVFQGDTIQAVVSAGSRFVEVPDLRGTTVDRAKIMLETVGLRLDDRIVEVRDRAIPPGQIVAHVPEPRRRVERGSSIRVQVASNVRQAVREPAQGEKKYLYTVRIRLTDILDPVTLRVDMTDSIGTKTVHEADYAPGADVEFNAEGYGPESTFRFFYNGELIKQVVQQADAGPETQPAGTRTGGGSRR
ncbi:MAG: PASTA domain-containing protein [Fimbriimonadaceae bacterium]